MRIVYAVSSGEYSDYGVDCLFEQEQDAAAFAGAGERVERFVMYAAGEQPKKLRTHHVNVTLWDDGTWAVPNGQWGRICYCVDAYPHMPDDEFEAPASGRPKAVEIRAPYLRGSGADLRVFGYDRQGVIHSFKDRFAKWAARTGYAGSIPELEWDGP